MMELFLQLDTWAALITLTFLEIILGIDNIIFIFKNLYIRIFSNEKLILK